MATGPNRVYSWDITKLLGPKKWTYYYLYVILDVFSRYAVGWMVATKESAALAEKLIADTCAKQQIAPGQLTVHADRGSSMTSKPVAFLLADLGITQSHSRPRVSNDNPYSEAQFKTLKYRPIFPASSTPSRGLGRTAGSSSPTTTRFTATPGWVCTLRPTSTTGTLRPCRPSELRCSPPPTWPTRSGSSTGLRHHPCCRVPRGSTHRPPTPVIRTIRRRPPLANFGLPAPHSG